MVMCNILDILTKFHIMTDMIYSYNITNFIFNFKLNCILHTINVIHTPCNFKTNIDVLISYSVMN